MLKTMTVRTTIAAILAGLSMSAHAIADAARPINVPAGDLVTALESLAKQADIELVYQAEQLRGIHTDGVNGTYEPKEAVSLLLKGTQLTIRTDDATGVMLVTPPRASQPLSVISPPGTGAGDTANAPESKSFWSRLRLAQKDTPSTSQVDAKNPSPSKGEGQGEDERTAQSQKRVELDEIVVTGSRLTRTSRDGAQDVRIYTREQIERSGQSTVADFLNTVPQVSLSSSGNLLQTFAGAKTVSLHGLPIGTTLVLVNGRRVETTGAQALYDFFDLNNIPIAAVDRIDIVPSGGSAVYGSDAIGGVVNVILKRNVEGLSASARYGYASESDEVSGNFSVGGIWSRASISLIGTLQDQSRLSTADRSITADSDYRRYGGPDSRSYNCGLTNVYSRTAAPLPGLGTATVASVPDGFSGAPTLAEFQGTAGILNRCTRLNGADISGASRRFGALLQGEYRLTDALELFVEVPYAHVRQDNLQGFQTLFGQPGFQSFTVAANNPFNPFGVVVGISGAFLDFNRADHLTTDFMRPLIGVRGSLFSDWRWEFTAGRGWDHTDETLRNGAAKSALIQTALNSADAATALNPFIDGSAASDTLIQTFFSDTFRDYTSRNFTLSGTLRGDVFELPAGKVNLVVGGEYARDSLSFNSAPYLFDASRHVSAAFAEIHLPLLQTSGDAAPREVLALNVAGRFDDYSDIGSKTTPQIGAEWRPLRSVLVRATYGTSFKAPSLLRLHLPSLPSTQIVTDPLRNQVTQVALATGGNPQLDPSTGRSRTFGLVYSSQALPGLQLSATHWHIDQDNSIQTLTAQSIVNNESLFPGAVIRDAPVGGVPGLIRTVNTTYLNFGRIDIAGLDYDASYDLRLGQQHLSASVAASQTYRYSAALLPGLAPTNRVSAANDP
jgi:iron complex outermembrane receptor protein